MVRSIEPATCDVSSDVPAGDVEDQLPALGVVGFATLQAVPHGDQLDFAHGPLQTQNETVVGVIWVVQAVLVGQELSEDGADLQEMIPVFGRSREPTEFQSQDQADVVQGDLGEQPLEAEPSVGGPAALPLILVDDQDSVFGPSEGRGLVRHGVLPFSRAL